MVEINANIRLRPIRIGFLVRPNDLASVQEVMRYCAAVWGGVYNPFIPVFSKPPKSWASDPFDRVRGIGVAKGYIRFFEPDVYVEAEKGLLELVGLGAVRDRLTVYPDVLTLSELLKPEKHKDWCVPAFGLNIQDVQAHLYRTDQQALSHYQIEHVTNLLACQAHAAATTSRHVCIAVALKAWCVFAEVRWRWTLKVL
jgi:hypothetical protein